MEKCILLIEDDKNLGIVIRDLLEMEAYKVLFCSDGKSGYRKFVERKQEIDIVILDIMLPEMDGFSVAKKIKAENPKIPLIFLTAKSLKKDRIEGLRIGADDYITKPFSTEEFLLRVNAILRRYSDRVYTETHKHQIGYYQFDANEQTLSLDSTRKTLTRRESALLNLLCVYKNKLLRREIALEEIWGENDYFKGRSMDVYIAKLRKMLKGDKRVSIENVHNTGFKLKVEEETV